MNYLIVFIAGTLLGSFFYTLAIKYHTGQVDRDRFRALAGRSKCPLCGKNIGIIYLVPVLGFLFARGRCSECGGRISPAYPIWEAVYGLTAMAALFHNGLTIHFAIITFIFFVLICISIVDFHSMIIPDTLLLVLLLLVVYPVIERGQYLDNLYGFLLVFLFMALVMFVFAGAFGGGDLKLMSIAGAYFGFNMSIVFLETTLVSGAVIGVIIALLKGKRNMKLKIPFAPFIALGFIVTELWGSFMLLAYFSFL